MWGFFLLIKTFLMSANTTIKCVLNVSLKYNNFTNAILIKISNLLIYVLLMCLVLQLKKII